MKTIIFCLPGSNFSNLSIQAWTQLYLTLPQYKVKPILRTATSNNIYHVRNHCLMGRKLGKTTQKPFQSKVKYDYIMWIDSDIFYQPEDFKSLLDNIEKNQKIHILGGLYFTETTKAFATNVAGRRLNPQDIQGKTTPMRVDSTGFGFTIIRNGVFESLTYPWFQPVGFTEKNKHREGFLGDDVSLCYRARLKGYNTHVLPSVIVGHQKQFIIR